MEQKKLNMTGFASQDKPWLKYCTDEQIKVLNAREQLKYLVNNRYLTIIMLGSYGTLSELMT